jgi:uncharacterized protein YggE
MPEKSSLDSVQHNYWYRVGGLAVLGLLSLYLLVLSMSEFKSMRFIGSGVSVTNTITVSGEGEVSAVPDTASFSATIMEKASSVKVAQEKASEKSNAVVDYLKSQDIPEKDIKTADYSVYPEYEYSTKACVANEYCVPGKQVLTGYQVSQTITVKVRDMEKAAELLAGVGSRGVSQVSGLSFTIDDEDELKKDARDKAIAKAKAKAEELAESLEVEIVRIVGFSEDGSYPTPYAYGRGGEMMAIAMDSKSSAPALPTGENKIFSNVTITYEIR